jgi:hypothetical protein
MLGVMPILGNIVGPLRLPTFTENRDMLRACLIGHTGAVAFSRTGDPATGDFRDATVLRKFGDVPDDLSAL